MRKWLEKHHADRTELLVGFYKVRAKKTETRITYGEALDEALCFGWIDGYETRIELDEARAAKFRSNRAAYASFEAQSPSYPSVDVF